MWKSSLQTPTVIQTNKNWALLYIVLNLSYNSMHYSLLSWRREDKASDSLYIFLSMPKREATYLVFTSPPQKRERHQTPSCMCLFQYQSIYKVLPSSVRRQAPPLFFIILNHYKNVKTKQTTLSRVKPKCHNVKEWLCLDYPWFWDFSLYRLMSFATFSQLTYIIF